MFGRSYDSKNISRKRLKETMKREGYIIEEIIVDDNLNQSLDYVLRGTDRKESKTRQWMLQHRQEVIERAKREISDGTFRISGFHEKTVKENDKYRTIQCLPLYERFVINAVMTVIDRHLRKRFITTSAASIKGKGTHWLHERIIRDRKNDPAGTRFIWKGDIRKFYENIDQDLLMTVFRRYFKDKKLIAIIEICVRLLKKGISIGLRTSQTLGNLYLSHFIAHPMKDRKRTKYFYEYCDDIMHTGSSYHALEDGIKTVHQGAKEARLNIKTNEQVFDIEKRDLDFLGFRLQGDGKIKLRKHIKQRFARRWRRVKSFKRKQQLIGAFYGIAKHAHAKHLFKTITGISMKKFSELGIQPQSEDGKKRFSVKTIRLSMLNNKTIEILDFETGIKTKHGEDRYVVLCNSTDTGNFKFMTHDSDICSILDQAREKDLLPFETTIGMEMLDKGGCRYTFN